MNEVTQKADRAEKLQASETFNEFLAETTERQVAVFRDVASSEADRAEAHAMLRALDKIKAQIARAVSDGKIARKRAAKRKP